MVEGSFEISARGQEGGQMPALGFGTATLKGDACVDAILEALRQGYRALDTALLYGNQTAVGEAIRRSGLDRSEIFLTSKVAFFPEGSDGVWMFNGNNVKGGEASSIDLCLRQLGVDYVDLLLIHNPCASAAEYRAACMPHFFELMAEAGSENAIRPRILPDGGDLRGLIMDARRGEARRAYDPLAALDVRKRSWRALEEAQRSGKARFIGVSNYPSCLLREMRDYATLMPAVNQLELHPRFSSPELRVAARDLGCVLTAYGTGNSVKIEQSAVLAEISQRLGKSPTQIVLRWTLQHGVSVIPRSGNADHIRENAGVFDFTLDDATMAQLDRLDAGHPYYWSPLPSCDTVRNAFWTWA